MAKTSRTKAVAAKRPGATKTVAAKTASKIAVVKAAEYRTRSHNSSSKTGTAFAPVRGSAPKTKVAVKMASKATAKPVELAKAGTKAAPATAGSAKMAVPKPAIVKPGTSKAAPVKAAPVKAAPVKAAAKPVAAKAASARPVATKAAPARPVATKPVATKSAPAKPVATKPVAAKPAAQAPSAVRPAGGAAVSVKSAAEKLAAVRAAIVAKAEVKSKAAQAPVPPPAPPSLVVAPKPFVPGGPRSGPSFSAGRPGFPPGSGPITKPMPKPQGGKHFGFKTLEYIVYPAHGVGQIVAIEEQQVAGYTLELFVVNFARDKLTLKVPAPKVAHGAIRKLADAALVQKSLDCLTGRARIKRTMWSRRAQEYEAKINSGDLIAIAEVVRDLYRSDAQPEQSYSERQLFEAALDRMAREIAAVQKLTDTEALKVLDNQLQKGPRRGVKTDSAVEADAGDTEVEEAA